MFPYLFLKHIGFYITGFWFFPGVLEGLGSAGRLIGTISTYPGTYKCPWSRVIVKNPPGGILFTEYSRIPYNPGYPLKIFEHIMV